MKKNLTLLFLTISLFSFSQTHEIADEYWDKAKKAEAIEDWENAAILFEKSAEAEKKSPNPRAEDLGIELNEASFYYAKISNYDKALPLAIEAIEITKKAFGKDNPNYKTYLDNLANLYESIGEYDEAIPLYIEILENTKKNLGKDHSEYSISLNNLAVLYVSMGEYAKALPLYIEALENTEKSLGKDNSEYGISLNNLAFTYESIGAYAKALPLYLEALENTEKSLGKDHSEYGISLNNLAGLYKIMGAYNKALPLSIEALENTEKSLGKDHSDYGMSLNNLGNLYESIGAYEKALPLYIAALENTEKSLGKDHLEYGSILSNLANLYTITGAYNKALPLSIVALENTEKSLGKDHSSYGVSLNNLANLYRFMGAYDKAFPLYLEALENSENSLGKDHSQYGVILNNLADSYKTIGAYDKALPLYLEALENTENSLGKDHSQYGAILNNQADVYNAMGAYAKALPLYIAALENTEKSLGKDHSSHGVCLNKLAGLYKSMGAYNKALPLYLEALENTDKSLGKDHSQYGVFLNNLAELYTAMGAYNKALPLYLEALENTNKSLGKGHSEYGSRLNNLANSYTTSGAYDKALPLFIESLKNTEKSLGKNHSNYGICLSNLANLYRSMGALDKALPLYLEAQENIEKSLGKDHSSYGTSLNNLAGLYESMSEYNKALPLYLEVNHNLINQIEEIFSFRSEKEKKAFLKTVFFNFDILQSFGVITQNKYKSITETNLNNQLLLKGLLLNSSKNVIEKLQALNDSVINETIINFKANKTLLTQQQSLPLAQRGINTDSLSETINTQEVALVRTYGEMFGETNTLTKDWNAIKSKLQPNDLAVEFSRFNYRNKKWTDSTMYVAYLYKKDWETPKVVNLFEEKQLKKYFSTSGNPNELYASRGGIATSTTATLAVADSIYNLVWKPLEKYVASSSTIYFSPDGLLHKIPFAALPNKGNKLIGELYNIQQMGNTADIRTKEKLPNLDDILLIGGVNYEYKVDSTKQKKKFINNVLESKELLGDTINRNISRNGFAYLPGTEKEVKDINTILGNSKQLSGYNATETAFKKLSSKSPSVLHIATHGFFFKKPKEEPKKNAINEQSNSYKDSDDPLLRSGLLFTNANYAWKNGNNPYEEDDGILTALEISNLDLKNTDIVILSACETGLGDIEGSEGVFGLQRAFKMAGVKTIIMSLWEVPDTETAEFMNLFYTKWKTYNNPKKAFKEAQQQMMNTYRETPEKWAAFVYFE
jgi:tetratricopeptide (TPR) repeat protein